MNCNENDKMADIFSPAIGSRRRRGGGGNAVSFGKYESSNDELLQKSEKRGAIAGSEYCPFVLRFELHKFRADFFEFVI